MRKSNRAIGYVGDASHNRIRTGIEESLRVGAALRLAMVEQGLAESSHAAGLITTCFQKGGKLLLFGNGGSAADAQHLAGEFMGRFMRERAPLPALALTADSAVLTGISNDFGFEQLFARQLQALGQADDLVIAISTSGDSPNVLLGVQTARDMGIATIGLTGGDGGQLAGMVDCAIIVPSTNTAYIQEIHTAIGHALCLAVELELAYPKELATCTN